MARRASAACVAAKSGAFARCSSVLSGPTASASGSAAASVGSIVRRSSTGDHVSPTPRNHRIHP
eukprot:1174094-Prymnesium_polylepis.1